MFLVMALFLWGLIIYFFLAGYIAAIKKEPDNPGVSLPLNTRISLSSLLLMAALFIMAGNYSIFTLCVFLGMLFSFAGNLAMAEIIRLSDRLMGGVAAFSIAHIFYITAFFQALSGRGMEPGATLTAGLVVYGAIITVFWFYLIRNTALKLYFNAGCLLYMLLIGVMASSALAMSANVGYGAWLAAFGAFSFVMSDLIIGATVIGGHEFDRSELWVWFTYVLGQMCIIFTGMLI